MKKKSLGIGLSLLGMFFVYGAVSNFAVNKALGNPVEGWFLLEILAFGLVGAAALVAGVVLLIPSLAAYVRQPPSPPG